MMRPAGLDFSRSLRDVLPDEDESRIADIAARQERTIDALLERLYTSKPSERREITLLADEVGLGKTFVALGVAWAVLRQRRQQKLAPGPVLVVTPQARALFQKWQREAEVFRERVAPRRGSFEIRTAETPLQLAQELRTRKPAVVIARMSALSGRLHHLDVARRAVLHSLLRMDGLELSREDRQELVYDWSGLDGSPEILDLRGSREVWEESMHWLSFGDRRVRRAWRRLERLNARPYRNLQKCWQRVRAGEQRPTVFWQALREVCRASLGQSVPHHLPLVIVDEIHNWKNHPQSWQRFLHMFGGRVDRLLGLSATPFQLGPHELIQVLELKACLALDSQRRRFLQARVEKLDQALDDAGAAGERLRNVWGQIEAGDVPEVERLWKNGANDEAAFDGQPPRLVDAIQAGRKVRDSHEQLMGHLRPFLIRHRRSVSHRAWWVGRGADPGVVEPTARGSALRWRPGLDVRGDAELVHYLMMTAVQEQKAGRGATSLGADLGGSYAFFREGELRRQFPGRTPAARRYLELVDEATGKNRTHEHPKVSVTAERAYRSWLRGEKTLVFCFNIKTTQAVREAIERRIVEEQQRILSRAFDCEPRALKQRLRNFQGRMYEYRQSVFLLFQDYPLAGPKGRLSASLCLRASDLKRVCERLAATGPPRDRARFDRRRIIAAAEQVLVLRWSNTVQGRKWLEQRARRLDREDLEARILSSKWIFDRRKLVEGVSRQHEAEPLPSGGRVSLRGGAATEAHIVAWQHILAGEAGRATLAPYLGDMENALPSLLGRYHAADLDELPLRLRALATRMLRRLIRSPGFLARSILGAAVDRPDVIGDEETLSEGWATSIHAGYSTPPVAGESARHRFEAYLDSLKKAVGLEQQIAAYEEATRNRDIVARVTGGVPGKDRDRFFTGFNTPLVPEVLVVTTVGQEGIDLHRECRHVIHHDLPWNPATLEQRTGRVDRIGSKTERLRNSEETKDSHLDVAVPYIASTYDEHRFRVVHGRAHLFEVTMGGDYEVDGHRTERDAMEALELEDDRGSEGVAWTPLPRSMAEDLKLRLEA